MSTTSRSTILNVVHHNASYKFSFLLESPLQSSIAILAPAILSQAAPALTQNNKKISTSMSRFVAILLAAAFVQSFAFVAPGAPRPALRSSTRYEQMQQTEIPEETSSPPFAAVLMASFVGLMLGFTSSPNVARAEESAAPVVDKKAKLKAEIEKAQAAIKKNAKSKEERLKEQIAQLKEVEKTAETDFATK